MALPRRTDAQLRAAFTGLVVESLAVRQDVARRTVRCAACADVAAEENGDTDPEDPDVNGTDPSDAGSDADSLGGDSSPDLGVGDAVVVVLRNYEGFTWEIQDVSCLAHGVDRVADAVGVEADDQAVVSCVLEAAGYHSPDGTYHPDALTLGDVTVLDYSPAADGYPTSGDDR
ncbi:hypothetical protein [Salinigranum sp. GCM10025319]|uniref:hypothetical protein n=1 Tax=Salinigranum sp. GCM10025319 TaxID=3252687 RepID=UPI0036162656